MKVEAMVFRFSKPSSSALTSPSAGDTAQGSVPTHQQSPQATHVPSPRALAVLPTKRAGWGGAAECVDCDVGVGVPGLGLEGSQPGTSCTPDSRAEASRAKAEPGDPVPVLAAWGAESMTAAQR